MSTPSGQIDYKSLTPTQDWAGLGLGLLGGFGTGLFPNQENKTTTGSGTSNTQTQQFGTSDLESLLKSILQSHSTTTGVSDTTTYGAQAGSSDMTTSADVTPTMSPETYALLHTLTQKAGGLQAPSLTGYGAQQTSQINANSQAQRQAVDQIMASRGLGTSPVAATSSAGIEQNRINQITSMQQQLPLLQNQMNLANLAGASSFFSTIPKGQTSTGRQTGTTQQQNIGTSHGTTAQTSDTTQTGEQQSTQHGQTTGASTSNTQTTQKQDQTSGQGKNPLGGLASGLMSALPFILPLFSDKNLKNDIKEISQSDAMNKVRELKGRAWKWKGGEIGDAGVIAQEVEQVIPELVHSRRASGVDLKAVNYAGLIPYLIGAVQNLDSRVGEVK